VLSAVSAAAFALGAAAYAQQTFSVGEAVEIEASKHWVPCVVTQPGPQVVRVNCSAYPALSRAAGSYIAENSPASIRKATGKVGLPAPQPKAAPAAAAQPAGLKIGEYACYGSGGRPMIGLGFKVLPGGRYTDLDGKNAGTFVVSGSTVTFRGGHLGGQTGRALQGTHFRIGAQASCEPW
jgi:hypothetical protein